VHAGVEIGVVNVGHDIDVCRSRWAMQPTWPKLAKASAIGAYLYFYF
jgi:hypothetical protein